MNFPRTSILGIAATLALAACAPSGEEDVNTDAVTTDTENLGDDGAVSDDGTSDNAQTGADDVVDAEDTDATGGDATASDKPVIFVIALENKGVDEVYGDYESAPYINDTLFPMGTHSTNFLDDLPGRSSEPHYIWMQAGTNKFADNEFDGNDDPSASNSTATPDHLANQIEAAGRTWMSYQEGLNEKTGACPINSDGFYHAKHDPFVFFTDIAGDPPSEDAPRCVAHHKPYSALADDLKNGTVADYNFITPDQCHDMHGQSGCPNNDDNVLQGDQWLEQNLPPILEYANAHNGVVFLLWDEPAKTGDMPFLALGPKVKQGYASDVEFGHSSLIKSIEGMLGLPNLATVTDANDFSDVFEGNKLP